MSRRQVVYIEECPESVALYITEHGGMITTERVDPAWVFHKVTFYYDNYTRFGGGDHSPIYKYALADGGQLLVQYIHSKGPVPGHDDAYWTVIYIERKGDDGKGAAATREQTQ